jgi:hypothetical protein
MSLDIAWFRNKDMEASGLCIIKDAAASPSRELPLFRPEISRAESCADPGVNELLI